MSIKTILHKQTRYPAFQAEGNAMQFAKPFAQKVCNGYGADIGCNRKEWGYVDADGVPALCVDVAFEDGYHALCLPPGQFDYIINSHCLEHLPNWVDALDYWQSKLKRGGTIFMYLPDWSQSYWRVFSNRKHIHTFEPKIIEAYLIDRGYINVFVSGVDLNNSFCAMAEKA